MPRPRICRRIFFNPHITLFKPFGVPTRHLQQIILTKEELEAIRLIDLEKQEQEKTAKKMQISQPTLSRILKSAREKTANALINGKAIKIQGGVYKMVQPRGRGMGLGRGAGQRAGGRGAGGGFAAGPGGECVCPKCGTKATHQTGVQCYQQKCPKCGSPMTRS